MKSLDKSSVILSFVLLFIILPQAASSQETDSFDILIPRNDYHLRGHIYEASGEGPFPIVILLQGIPGGERDVLSLGQKLSEAGIHAFTFNYSGTHNSGGKWTLANDMSDVRAAYNYIHQPEFVKRHLINKSRVFLGGYSHGGGAALLFAAGHPEIDHVISIGGNDFGEWARRTKQDTLFAKAVDGIFANYIEQGWIRPAEGADSELLNHADKYDVRKHAPDLIDRNILLIGGLDDQTTAIEDHMLPLYRALQQNGAKQIQALVYQADHSFSNGKDKLARDIIDWIQKNK